MKNDRPTAARMVKVLGQVREKGSFNLGQLSCYLRVNLATVSGWERGRIKKIDPVMFEKVKRLSALLDEVSTILPTIDAFEKFFFTRQAGLPNGFAPVDLLGNEYCFKRLLDFIEGSKAGDMG